MIWNRRTFFRLPCEKQKPQSSTSPLMEHGWSSSTVCYFFSFVFFAV
uniref:Uncharacterized protein n=1 Tax=Anguilla anguilla TaxID=7936 RepID=A0A0E9W311_ANGAN